MQENKSNIVVYSDGELELKISVNDEIIWFTQKELGELFNKELIKNSTTRKIKVVQKEENREIERDIDHYNLDMIILIGYRVNFITATKFQQWATSILRNYIQNAYVINGEKITNDRFLSLEKEVTILKSKVENISNSLEDKTLQPKQGIFYNTKI